MVDYGINRTWLKIIALVTMTIDHIGFFIFPDVEIFRIIGRISFPLFAYMIAEGAYYTKHRSKYLLLIFGIGFISFVVYAIAARELYLSILVGFAISLALIYLYNYIRTNYKDLILVWITAFILVFAFGIFCSFPPQALVSKFGFHLDYTIFGIVIPLIVYIFYENKWLRITVFTALLVIMSCIYAFVYNVPIEFYCLLSILFIMVYNGKKGKISLKYFFYFYYPIHVVLLYFISTLIR